MNRISGTLSRHGTSTLADPKQKGHHVLSANAFLLGPFPEEKRFRCHCTVPLHEISQELPSSQELCLSQNAQKSGIPENQSKWLSTLVVAKKNTLFCHSAVCMRRQLIHLKGKAMGGEMAQWLREHTALAEDIESTRTPNAYSHL